MIRLFRVFVPVGALALLFSEILLTASCFLVVTFLILNVDPPVFLSADNGLPRIAVVVASILFGLYFEDLYKHIYVNSRVLLIQQLSLVMGIALLIQGFIGYVNDGLRLPLRVMLPAGALMIVALVCLADRLQRLGAARGGAAADSVRRHEPAAGGDGRPYRGPSGAWLASHRLRRRQRGPTQPPGRAEYSDRSAPCREIVAAQARSHRGGLCRPPRPDAYRGSAATALRRHDHRRSRHCL